MDGMLTLTKEKAWKKIGIYWDSVGSTAGTKKLTIGAEVTVYPADPILGAQNVDRTLMIVQGSTGLRNINIAGAVQYQLIPLQRDMKMVSISMPPGVTFNPLEEYRLLLNNSGQSHVRQIYTRSDYTRFITSFAEYATDPANVSGLAASAGLETGVGHALVGDLLRGLFRGVRAIFGKTPGELLH